MWCDRTLSILYKGGIMELTGHEILGAYQLNLLSPNEARVALGFKPLEEAIKDIKDKEDSNG